MDVVRGSFVNNHLLFFVFGSFVGHSDKMFVRFSSLTFVVIDVVFRETFINPKVKVIPITTASSVQTPSIRVSLFPPLLLVGFYCFKLISFVLFYFTRFVV